MCWNYCETPFVHNHAKPCVVIKIPRIDVTGSVSLYLWDPIILATPGAQLGWERMSSKRCFLVIPLATFNKQGVVLGTLKRHFWPRKCQVYRLTENRAPTLPRHNLVHVMFVFWIALCGFLRYVKATLQRCVHTFDPTLLIPALVSGTWRKTFRRVQTSVVSVNSADVIPMPALVSGTWLSGGKLSTVVSAHSSDVIPSPGGVTS